MFQPRKIFSSAPLSSYENQNNLEILTSFLPEFIRTVNQKKLMKSKNYIQNILVFCI